MYYMFVPGTFAQIGGRMLPPFLNFRPIISSPHEYSIFFCVPATAPLHVIMCVRLINCPAVCWKKAKVGHARNSSACHHEVNEAVSRFEEHVYWLETVVQSKGFASPLPTKALLMQGTACLLVQFTGLVIVTPEAIWMVYFHFHPNSTVPPRFLLFHASHQQQVALFTTC